MIPTRRDVLAAGLALPFAPRALTASPGRAGKLLILGGTRFLGPAIVQAALAAGWEVTLFNRGRSNPHLFPELEKLKGDRDEGQLDALKGRKWDAVVDTSGYVPGHVRATAEILADNAGHYVFVSTISVYADQSPKVVSEDQPVLRVSDEVIAEVKTIRDAYGHYGAMKALCEEAAEKAMPGRVANVRPGLIVGPGDSSDRFTYWPARVHRGGEVLAPGNPDGEVQFVDVRDLGAFCFHASTQRVAGVLNALGFPFRLSMQELLHTCKVTLGADCRFTWVEEKFLAEHRVRPYSEMPLWLPAGRRGHIDNRKAMEAGHGFRPIPETITDTLQWHLQERSADHEWRRAGMRPEREAELLAKLR